METVLKGVVPADPRVRSVVDGASCGLERMYGGERYTVFARAEGGELRSGLCDGTHSGGPHPALALVSGMLLSPTPGVPPWWALSFIVSAAILSGAVARREWAMSRNRRGGGRT